MSQYYGESQWPGAGAGQPTWDHQTPPPARSGASSAIPREEPAAFTQQIEEVDRAIDNLVKSGKMFGMSGRHGRAPSGPPAPRSHSVTEFGDARVGHQGGPGPGPGPASGPGLQNFYANQRHQTSRGSNEAEQMMQAKRRMAAQRERELRNYHQEQQYNRTVLAEMSYPGTKPDRALSPGSMSEDDRRDLIARQRSALYGDTSSGENGGFGDENGAPRSGAPGLSTGPSSHRGHSPLAYDYSRGAPEGVAPARDGQGSRAGSNASPQSNPSNSKGPFDNTIQQASCTSNSSPSGSPPRQGNASNQTGNNTVAPIGTRPAGAAQPTNPALNKRSTTPLPSPLSHGYTASGNGTGNVEENNPAPGAPPNPSSATPDGYNGWGNRPGVWGKQTSGLGVQASVWG
ncbi:uncharacterized protein BCR38DRAFT_44961 [Pseudomassariella vexata]|uniref:Uncharacterized protein n=1 Tax=Pseudomassariella vexata TaxID=1141098 RepID=A0A1Y2DN47_9PEZI|nr:uncharacterized protein BCR38DRAFT_44961 [Pseudomassariella vexata]ORY60702.1 hypothetical protein BCR38DRAFT_44961 [Pseudomassariella vexata]